MSRRRNTFSKAIKQLKSEKIDERLQTLNEIPTNNTMGYMTGTPNTINPDFVSRDRGQESALHTIEPDFTADDPSLNGRDTSGLFKEDGTIRTAEPPGDTSPILGPMASMYYTYANPPWTTIGYIRQSDRKMVNMARITGKLTDWDGVSDFTNSGYGGQLTIAQAVWYKNIQKQDGDTSEDGIYRAFYPGPPSSSPDAFGRYYCTITGAPKETPLSGVGEPENLPGTSAPATPEDTFSAIMDRIAKGKKLSEAEKQSILFPGNYHRLVNHLSRGSRQSRGNAYQLRRILALHPFLACTFHGAGSQR